MKRITPLLIVAVAMFFSCCRPNLENEIAKLEKQAFSTEGVVEPQLAGQLVDAYCEFVNENPDEKVSADYLFKAVEVSMNLDNPQRTISIIDRMIKEYPDCQQTSKALFLKGFIYETRFGNYGMAKKTYEKYLELYPNGELANDCRTSIENLGVDPEELIKKFESQHQD